MLADWSLRPVNSILVKVVIHVAGISHFIIAVGVHCKYCGHIRSNVLKDDAFIVASC